MDLIIDQTIADIEEDMEEQFLVDLENTKRKGVEALQRFISSDQRAIDKHYNYSTYISDETLQAILSGKLKDFNKIDNYDFEQGFPYREKNNYLLVQFTIHSIENKGIYVVESVYINNDFINN